MKTHCQLHVAFLVVSTALLVLRSEAAAADGSAGKRSKEVIESEDGKDRHWVIKVNGLIVEEHGLTAHGDLHVMVEYPDGVRTPQIDAQNKDTNVASITTMFWPSGKRMSRTPAIGDEPDGQDLLWWPTGKLFRDARFVMGRPSGVWKYWDQKGKVVGKGSFENGKRQSGLFIGDNRPGSFFFFTSYPLKQQKFKNGVLKEEHDFLKELEMR